MKVVAFNGSPNVTGNTSVLLDVVLKKLNENDIKTELIHVGSRNIHGCIGCGKCRDENNGRCMFNDDIINDCINKIDKAQGIILGSPVYFGNMTSQMKAFIDRVGYVCKPKGYLRGKICASCVVARRNGALATFNSMNNLFTICEGIIVSSSYWNQGVGVETRDVINDTEGIKTMETLGENFAKVLKRQFGEKIN